MNKKLAVVKNKGNRTKTISPSEEESLLLESAKIASSKAVRTCRALGLTIKVIRDNHIIAIRSDKSTKVLKEISKSKIDTSSLKKGMTLERK